MTAVMLDLSFCCCHCDEATQFTVHCSGAGLDAGSRITIQAKVDCFHCGTHHQVAFHPTGEVIAVELCSMAFRIPIPSRN